MQSLRNGPGAKATPEVGQCVCRLKLDNDVCLVRHGTYSLVSRTERIALWCFVCLGTILMIGCYVMEVKNRHTLDILARKCSCLSKSSDSYQFIHNDVTTIQKQSQKSTKDNPIIGDEGTQTMIVEGRHQEEARTTSDFLTADKTDPKPHKKRQQTRIRSKRSVNVQSLVRASHFVACTGKADEFQHTNADCINKWDGLYCRNSTYWSENLNQVLKFFIPGDWTSEHNEDILPALVQSIPGSFTVEIGGLYLIYINVIIRTTEDKHDVEVYSDDTRLLRCRQGLDYVRINNDRFLYSKTRTCSVMGLFYLNGGVTITTRVLQPRTTLSLGPDSTNFGAVLYPASHPFNPPYIG